MTMFAAARTMQGEICEHPFEQTVEIVLDPEVLGAICRQGRRRLRDIQSSSQAALKLDRFRGVLQVTGSTDAIANVHRQLESLSGPALTVTAAVWAELMRTRTNPDSSQAAIARLQEQSGCRIHIERNAQQVQLFGPKNKTDVGQKLLEELKSMCLEEAVNMKCPLYLDLQMLQKFAQEFGVTLQVEERMITVLGIEGAVVEAAKELRNYDSEERQIIESGKPSDVARSAIDDAMSALMVEGGPLSFSVASADSLPPMSAPTSDNNMMQGAVTSKVPPPAKVPTSSAKGQSQSQEQSHQTSEMFSQCNSCGAANFCVHCGKPSGKMMQGHVAACRACGTANFCVYCGQPTEKMMNNGSLPRAYGDGACQNYDPDMFNMDRMPMNNGTSMPMNAASMPMNTMMHKYQMPQMPQMVSGGGGGRAPVLMPAGMMPNGMMMMIPCISSGEQAVMPGTTPGCGQAASNMLASTANGIQACMMPMAYGTLE